MHVHSDNARSRVKKDRNMIDPGDCPVIVHGAVPSKPTNQTPDKKPRKRKRGQKIAHHHSGGGASPSVPERRGFDSGGPQYNALRDKNWLHGLTDANVKQLPEQSRHSFSIPTADVEEPSAVLSGSGISINQQARLRDINSCISALQLAYRTTLKYAMEKLVAERDRVLNPQDQDGSLGSVGDDDPGDPGFYGRVYIDN
ncbi:hypothetical protein V500_01444 [Pseudogymnoascus sp. VKM F-4518 (FW-2643)]|nr:hypothetical protein V500_01444 [Pseudogymnoascus sp. VKM F-4518 (FW-2643)]